MLTTVQYYWWCLKNKLINRVTCIRCEETYESIDHEKTNTEGLGCNANYCYHNLCPIIICHQGSTLEGTVYRISDLILERTLFGIDPICDKCLISLEKEGKLELYENFWDNC